MSTAPGPYDAITDVPGIEVGHHTSLRDATGCTVIVARGGARPGVFQPGGAPGTFETDLAASANAVTDVHAVLLTGGSVFGMEAATGVRRYLREEGVGLPMPPDDALPIVMGAVVFDLAHGEHANPQAAHGRIAARSAASGRVRQGTVGAGTGCTVAKGGEPDTQLKGGLGTASLSHDSGLVVGAVVATNSVGDIIDPASGELVAGPRAETPGEMLRSSELTLSRSQAELDAIWDEARPRPVDTAGANTTLAVIATNARLHKGTAERIAIMGSAGLARTISPVFTPGDGDTVFTLSTGEIDVTTNPLMLSLTGIMAAEVVARATLRGVQQAESLAGVPSVSEWRSLAEAGAVEGG